MAQLLREMRDVHSGIERRNRYFDSQNVPSSFKGSQLVEWLVRNGFADSDAAGPRESWLQQAARELARVDLLSHARRRD